MSVKKERTTSDDNADVSEESVNSDGADIEDGRKPKVKSKTNKEQVSAINIKPSVNIEKTVEKDESKDSDANNEIQQKTEVPDKNEIKDDGEIRVNISNKPVAKKPVSQERASEQVNGDDILLQDLQKASMAELVELAIKEGVQDVGSLKRQELIFRYIHSKVRKNGRIYVEGVLEVLAEGFGFLRSTNYNYVPSPDDIYISPGQIRKLGLRTGAIIKGQVRPPREGEKYFAILKVDSVNDCDIDQQMYITRFESLTPIHPIERFILESSQKSKEMRVMDIFTPIGKGQRGLIVAPPRTGKTILLQKIANSVLENHPETYLIVLLVDERPEEVTDFQRNLMGDNFEVASSCFDEPPARHVHVVEMVLNKAKRMVERKRDVVILVDSLTRMTRAYNNETPHSGRILSGGIDATAFKGPKSFFGAARKIEEGGSLTIIATCLIDTGSRMDEVIFEEFKGTGNMELHLDRQLADRRLFPAIDITRSGTRKEELLVNEEELQRVWLLRRGLIGKNSVEAMEWIIHKIKKTGTNIEFLLSLPKKEVEF